MAENESEATATTIEEAAPAEPAESTPAAQDQETGADSIEEAFAQAKAELVGDESQGSAEAADSTTESQETTQAADSDTTAEAQTETEKPTRKIATDQGTLDRIKTLVEQGREAELDPAARGVLRGIREALAKETAQEEAFRTKYLEFETERLDDPEAFSEKVLQNPRIAEFMRAYKRNNPDISLDNPSPARKMPSPDEVRAEVGAEYVSKIQETVEQIADAAGVDTAVFAKLKTEVGDRPGALMLRTFEAALEAAVEKERPKIAAAERAAADLEAQAKWAPKTIITPRVIGGSPVDGQVRDPSKPYDIFDAFAEAQAELESVG